MKKILLFLTLVPITTFGQQIPDALRYAQEFMPGSARFGGMGGAFGALGGDVSAISVNPAGSAVFNVSQVSATLTSYNMHNAAMYYGNREKLNDNNFDINSGGGVYVFGNDDEKSDWKKFTLGVDFENIGNLSDSWYAAGRNPNRSIAEYFLHYANGAASPLGLLQQSYYEDLSYADAQAFLGYQGYVINPSADDPDNTSYTSNVPAGVYDQQNELVSSGFNGKLAFNVAAQYTDRFYFGLNVNSYFSDYTQATLFQESNVNDPTAGVNYVRFDNALHTTGTGFSFQLGAIAKVTPSLRVGLAYDSPVWYKFTDDVQQRLFASYTDAVSHAQKDATVDPNVVITYAPYSLHAPGKWTGSAAYIFGTNGLLSIDCSVKDYSALKFRPTGDFDAVNRDMKDLLDHNAFEIRAGGEQRYKQWSFRGGWRWQESPYRNGEMGDLNGFSAGIGYNFEGMKFDLAYSHTSQTVRQAFFGPAFNEAPEVKKIGNNISVSVVLELDALL